MTLEEAIYELEDLRSGDLELGREKAANAEGLGIEALKRELHSRGIQTIWELRKLPGETKGTQ